MASRDQSAPICSQQKLLSFYQSNVFTLPVLRTEKCTLQFIFLYHIAFY